MIIKRIITYIYIPVYIKFDIFNHTIYNFVTVHPVTSNNAPRCTEMLLSQHFAREVSCKTYLYVCQRTPWSTME